MGLLSFLTGKKVVERGKNVVWLNTAAKHRGVLAGMRDGMNHRAAVVLVAHFPATLDALAAALKTAQVPFVRDTAPHDLNALAKTSTVNKLSLVMADQLRPSPAPPKEGKNLKLVLVVAEHHFLRAKDEAIEKMIAECGMTTVLVFHTAMDEPFMAPFVGGQTLDVLKAVGVTDREPIGHPMIDQALIRAEERFTKQAATDRPAPTAKDWLRINAPNARA